MDFFNITSYSPEYTMKIAYEIAKYLNTGDSLILTGELGSGKTKFTEGFLTFFNLQNEISSPTFNIVNEYNYKNINIYHFDVYRLTDLDEFYSIGGEEYFEKGICLIEWGELIEDALPKEYIKISFEKDYTQENCRLLKIKAFGKRYENIIKNVKEDLK